MEWVHGGAWRCARCDHSPSCSSAGQPVLCGTIRGKCCNYCMWCVAICRRSSIRRHTPLFLHLARQVQCSASVCLSMYTSMQAGTWALGCERTAWICVCHFAHVTRLRCIQHIVVLALDSCPCALKLKFLSCAASGPAPEWRRVPDGC